MIYSEIIYTYAYIFFTELDKTANCIVSYFCNDDYMNHTKQKE